MMSVEGAAPGMGPTIASSSLGGAGGRSVHDRVEDKNGDRRPD